MTAAYALKSEGGKERAVDGSTPVCRAAAAPVKSLFASVALKAPTGGSSVARSPFEQMTEPFFIWIGIDFDIDERKQAEVELRRSKAYLAEAQRGDVARRPGL